MISLISYKDHIWFLQFRTRIIYDFLIFIQEPCVFWLWYFYINCFSAFFDVMWEVIEGLNTWFPIRFINDFLDFMQGSYMVSRISFRIHIWFPRFHQRIIYDFLAFIKKSYMMSLVPCKDRTRKYFMICMTSYMILAWNQGSGDPRCWLVKTQRQFKAKITVVCMNYIYWVIEWKKDCARIVSGIVHLRTLSLSWFPFALH